MAPSIYAASHNKNTYYPYSVSRCILLRCIRIDCTIKVCVCVCVRFGQAMFRLELAQSVQIDSQRFPLGTDGKAIIIES
jgi:hypothetical protein